MIRIKLIDGETVETSRHTFEQATTAVLADKGIEVGGEDDEPELISVVEPELVRGADRGLTIGEKSRPVRTLLPAEIASIEKVEG